MEKKKSKSGKEKDKTEFLIYNKKVLILAIVSFILAILCLICLVPQKVPKSNLGILFILLSIITSILIIGIDLAYFVILLLNYLSIKWQEAKYTNQTTNLTFALYNVAWSKEPVYAVLNSLSKNELKIPSKEGITNHFGNKPYVNQYLLYSQLVKRFSKFEESRLKTIKNFLSIKYQKFSQKINIKIISSSMFLILFLFWMVFVPQSGNVSLEKIKTIEDLIKLWIVNSSGLIRTLIYQDPVSSALICVYFVLLFILLPFVLIERDLKVHNETQVILATVEEALEEQDIMKDNKSSDSQDRVDESPDNKVENKTKKDIDMGKETLKSNSENTQDKNVGKSSDRKTKWQKLEDMYPYLVYVGYVIAGVLILSGIFNAVKCGGSTFDLVNHGITLVMYYSIYFLFILAMCIVYLSYNFQKLYKNENKRLIIISFIVLNVIIVASVFRPFVECCTQSKYDHMWFYNIVFFLAISCIVVSLIYYYDNKSTKK